MNRIQIDCFMTAADTGSIAAAAGKLFLTQQSVSQNIQALEKETGSALFVRSKSGVQLTEGGKKLYSFAVQWQDLYAGTQQKIREYYSGITHSFHIGITEYVDILGRISRGLSSFREKYPDTEITGLQHRNKVLLEQIEQGDLDVTIINELQIVNGGDFDYVAFAKEDLRLFISGYQPKKTTQETTIEELREACREIPHISTSYGIWETSDWEEISRRTTSFLGYDFTSHYESENFRSCVLNLDTIPCSVVCDSRFGYTPHNKDIFNIPLKTDSRLCILWNRKNENPLIREFTDHMTAFYQ